jgi:hypothetical protein
MDITLSTTTFQKQLLRRTGKASFTKNFAMLASSGNQGLACGRIPTL